MSKALKTPKCKAHPELSKISSINSFSSVICVFISRDYHLPIFFTEAKSGENITQF